MVPNLDHVFVIVMENHSYGEIIGNPQAPFINSLVGSGGLANNYFAVAHPSLPNYLALVSGSTQGITSDCTTCWISNPNVGDLLESGGRTWKAYAEGMPSPCFVGDAYPYVQKHNPFIYFNDVRNNATRCQSHDVPYAQLSTDLGSTATTPNFAFITPNVCNDMHDTCSSTQSAITAGDTWLQQQIPQILGAPAFTKQNSALILTWDEDDSTSANHVATIVLGNQVTPGVQSGTQYTHYSTLRTVEAAFGLPAITANDAPGPSLGDFFALAGWNRLGGWSWSAANASSWASTRSDAFVVGGDNGLWQNTWNGTAWSGWSGLGGAIIGDPAAVSWGSSHIDVVVRGADNSVWHRYWNGSSWSAGWEGLGGLIQYSPGVASWATNRLDIFVVGTDNALWHKAWDGTKWWPWESLGGYLTSKPAAVSWSTGRIDIVARGGDGQMYHLYWQTDHWSQWEAIGGLFSSGPGMASCSYYRLDIFALGVDGMVWRKSWTGSWTPWEPNGWPGTSDPGVVCLAGTKTIQIFERAPDMSIVQSTVAAS